MTLKRISMRDQVYEIIKNRILSREYSLGEPINIVHLSKELGISNTPIREALSQLETERLITINSNQKYHVTDLNEKLINDLCSVVLIHLLGAFKVCRDNGKMPVLISKLRKPLKNSRKCMTLPTAMTMLLHQWISNGLSLLLLIILCWKKHMTLLSPY